MPKVVSLPEVAEYTDDIIFGNLALPSGFDEEQLLVNISAFNRRRIVAGLGTVSVVSERGDRSITGAEVTGIDASGAATFGKKMISHKVPLARGSVHFPSGISMVGTADATITVNANEVEERIQATNGTSALYNPVARAKQLNHAVQEGLAKACLDANADPVKEALSVSYYLGTLPVLLITNALNIGEEKYVAYFLTGALVNHSFTSLTSMFWKRYGISDAEPLEVVKHTRISLTAGVALDRIIASKLLTKTTRLIQSR
jgi:hypothetical protein